MQGNSAQVHNTDLPRPLRMHITSMTNENLGLASLIEGTTGEGAKSFLLDTGRMISSHQCTHTLATNARDASPFESVLHGPVEVFKELPHRRLEYTSLWTMHGTALKILSLEIREANGHLQVVAKFIAEGRGTRNPSYQYLLVKEDTFPPHHEE